MEHIKDKWEKLGALKGKTLLVLRVLSPKQWFFYLILIINKLLERKKKNNKNPEKDKVEKMKDKENQKQQNDTNERDKFSTNGHACIYSWGFSLLHFLYLYIHTFFYFFTSIYTHYYTDIKILFWVLCYIAGIGMGCTHFLFLV